MRLAIVTAGCLNHICGVRKILSHSRNHLIAYLRYFVIAHALHDQVGASNGGRHPRALERKCICDEL